MNGWMDESREGMCMACMQTKGRNSRSDDYYPADGRYGMKGKRNLEQQRKEEKREETNRQRQRRVETWERLTCDDGNW